LPKPGTARGVQIDIDGSRLSLALSEDINIVGDSAPTLRAPLLNRNKNHLDSPTREE
jgi:pyruvate dehydrogenase (quinone)